MNIGITGNIGSGKTTICRIFETLEIPIYYADDQAKKLMVDDLNVKEQVKLVFGLSTYDDDGELDKKYLGDIVFNNPKMLTKLNYIVHPAVERHSLAWAKKQKGALYTIKEAALLIESGNYKSMDKIIVVTAPLDLRIARVMARDKVEKSDVLLRNSKQMSEEEKVALADYVIINDGNHSLVKQVQKIHQQLMTLV